MLVSTDSLAEGLNLHQRCFHLIHLDLPYNPNRLEQRNGRIDRYGQRNDPEIRYLYLAGTFEERLLLRLIAKYEKARACSRVMPETLGVTADQAEYGGGLVSGFAEKQAGLFDDEPSAIRTIDRAAEGIRRRFLPRSATRDRSRLRWFRPIGGAARLARRADRRCIGCAREGQRYRPRRVRRDGDSHQDRLAAGAPRRGVLTPRLDGWPGWTARVRPYGRCPSVHPRPDAVPRRQRPVTGSPGACTSSGAPGVRLSAARSYGRHRPTYQCGSRCRQYARGAADLCGGTAQQDAE